MTFAASAQEQNIFPDGNFEGELTFSTKSAEVCKDFKAADEGTLYIEPGDYKHKGGVTVSIETEDGNKFLRFHNPPESKLDGNLRTFIVLKLPTPPPSGMTLSLRWRIKDFVLNEGAPDWAAAQCNPMFLLQDGTTTKSVNIFRGKADTDWVEKEKSISIPDGATHLILQPGIKGVRGTFDIDDLKVIMN
jgi:hypothetical protein